MLCSVCMSVCMSVSLSVCMYVCILALPLCSPVFPAKNTVFQRFRKEDVQNTEFSRFSAKDAGSPSQQKSWQGESSLGPLFCDTGSPKTTFSGTSSNCRAVLGGGGVWFSDQLISHNIWLKAPFVYHCSIHDRVKQKNLSRPLAGLSTRQSTRDNPSSNHPQWHIGFSPEEIQGPKQRPLLPQATSSFQG